MALSLGNTLKFKLQSNQIIIKVMKVNDKAGYGSRRAF